MGIEVKNLVKRFGNFTAIDDLSLDVPSGELVALLGPSGSGKTTLLRIIAGLEDADKGQVIFEGREVGKKKTPKIEVWVSYFNIMRYLDT
ncbi:Sulfate/thiosulfate import ATP-binding protein CysA [Leptospira interrogans]